MHGPLTVLSWNQLMALRLYEHTSEQQKQDVTKIINSTDTTIQAVEGMGNHD